MPENHFKFTLDPSARLVFILLAGVFTALAAMPVFAAVESEQTINWGVMGMQLFGGLALFLFGMEQMADALKAVADRCLQGDQGRAADDWCWFLYVVHL